MLKLFAKPIHGISATCLLGIAFLAECGSIKPTSQDTETKAGWQDVSGARGQGRCETEEGFGSFP